MKSFGPSSLFVCDGAHGCRIGAIDPEIGLGDILTGPTVDLQMAGPTGTLIQPCQCFGLIDGVLRHFSIRRPLAAGNGQQAGVGDQNCVVSGQRGCVPGVSHLHQRPQTSLDTEDITAPGALVQILRNARQDEFDLLIRAEAVGRDITTDDGARGR